METLIVLSIVALAAAYFIRKMYNAFKKGGEYKCSACAMCPLCDAAVKDNKKNC